MLKGKDTTNIFCFFFLEFSMQYNTILFIYIYTPPKHLQEGVSQGENLYPISPSLPLFRPKNWPACAGHSSITPRGCCNNIPSSSLTLRDNHGAY